MPVMSRTPPPTPRLEFRRWSASDLDLAASLWCNPDVMRFIGGPYTPDEVASRVERELANDARYEIQYWPLFTIENGEFAGCCGLKPHNDGVSTLEIGFQLLPDFWGAGYASEAARAVITYAFEYLHATALYAGRHPLNAASHKLLTKLGFTQIGTHYFARTAIEHPWYELRRG